MVSIIDIVCFGVIVVLTIVSSFIDVPIQVQLPQVRPCTVEAVQFVEAVTEKEKPRGELRELLRRACSRHQRLYQVL